MRIGQWERHLSLVALAYLTGCFLLPIPDMKTAADHAREVAPRCRFFSEDAIRELVSPSLVESVEPSYSYVASSAMAREARLRGALIHLRPTSTLSRESLQRSLECHQAHVVLGFVEIRDDDPYVLPGTWLEIDADSEGDGFVVAVQTKTFDTAQRVLVRARRFAPLRR